MNLENLSRSLSDQFPDQSINRLRLQSFTSGNYPRDQRASSYRSCIYICKYIIIYIHTRIRIHVRPTSPVSSTRSYSFFYIYIIYIYIYMYTYVYTYIYIWFYITYVYVYVDQYVTLCRLCLHCRLTGLWNISLLPLVTMYRWLKTKDFFF